MLENELEQFKNRLCKKVADDIYMEINTHWSLFKSTPDSPPAIQSGELMRSISTSTTSTGAQVNIDAPYAGQLEYIGVGNNNNKYPFARPAMMRTLIKLDQLASEIFE